MKSFDKPIVVISKCLGFDACRYNGAIIEDSVIEKLEPYIQIITVCPEVEIGLGVPREPIRLIWKDHKEKRLFQPATGRDLTKEMLDFSGRFLNSLEEPDGFILKNRSPSCAIRDAKVYGEGEMLIQKEGGMFGSLVTEQYNHLAIEDEGRLKNEDSRGNFLTKLFILAGFRTIKKTTKLPNLIEFHRKNKYIFMAFHPLKQKELGQVVSNQEKRPVEKMYQIYEQTLYQLLATPFTRGTMINSLLHIFGYFSKQLNSADKSHFLSIIDQYKLNQMPLSSPLNVLQEWTHRFHQEYLLDQTIFEPYPRELG